MHNNAEKLKTTNNKTDSIHLFSSPCHHFFHLYDLKNDIRIWQVKNNERMLKIPFHSQPRRAFGDSTSRTWSWFYLARSYRTVPRSYCWSFENKRSLYTSVEGHSGALLSAFCSLQMKHIRARHRSISETPLRGLKMTFTYVPADCAWFKPLESFQRFAKKWN